MGFYQQDSWLEEVARIDGIETYFIRSLDTAHYVIALPRCLILREFILLLRELGFEIEKGAGADPFGLRFVLGCHSGSCGALRSTKA